ncbi:MAG: glycosyltransferase family 2 protein [Oscillospiraceae bacterium]|nr:glycosyltransferase family 2 protein [Oscillospiraceae bacterium]
MKTLIIIPCYNERDTISELCKEVCSKTNHDIIVINDCSTDDSKSILQKGNIPHLNLPINLGIGGAVQTGYRFAIRNNYDIAVQLDGDGQHDPDWIDKVIAPIIQGVADLTIGSRYIDKAGFQSTVIRRVGIRFFTVLIYCLSGKKITDATSGFRAANRKTMQLFTKYYAADYPEPESNMHAIKNKLRVCEVPVKMRERQGGKSSISAIKSVYYMLKVSIGIIISVIKPKVKMTELEV